MFGEQWKRASKRGLWITEVDTAQNLFMQENKAEFTPCGLLWGPVAPGGFIFIRQTALPAHKVDICFWQGETLLALYFMHALPGQPASSSV